MGAITLAMAQAALDRWMEADAALATGQSYEIDIAGSTRKLTRADAGQIQKRIEYYARMVDRLTATGGTGPKVRLAVPRDR